MPDKVKDKRVDREERALSAVRSEPSDMSSELSTPRNGRNSSRRKANQRSTEARFGVFLGVLIFAVILAGSYFGYLYVNRDKADTVLTIGAGPRGTDSYQLMSEISEVVARHGEGVQVRVLATAGSSQNVQLLNRGAINLATIGGGTPVVSDVQLVTHLFSDYFNVIARSDSRIKRFQDLRGRLIALPPDGSDGLKSFWAIADHYDLPVQSVKFVSMDFKQAHKALLAKKVDAIFKLSSLRDRQLLNMFEDAELTQIPLEMISIDQAAAISLKRPFLVPERIPRGAFTGAFPAPRWDLLTSSIRRNLVGRSDTDVEAVKELTRILFEHRLDLMMRLPLAGAISQPELDAGLTVPLHEGAAAYYDRDKPSYIQENAEPLALGVTLTAMIISALLALRSRLAAGQKNRADKYNYELLDIADNARKADDIETLLTLQNQLNSILETVVVALDTDEVTDEGFQSFSLLWESVRQQLAERRRELL